MGKIYEQIIDRFDGGISEDKRIELDNYFSITKHFDIFTYPKKLVPYPGTTPLDENKANKIRRFIYAPYLSGANLEYNVYGLGLYTSGTDKIRVYRLNSSDVWTPKSNGDSSRIDATNNIFFYYKDWIYMFGASQYLMRCYTVNDADAFQNSYADLTSITDFAPPVHHPADDIAYFFTDNLVHRLNGTSAFEPAVLTLPSDLKIVSACPYGNYLAIGCITKGSNNIKSIVFLWDRDSSLTTLSDRIDIGSGKLQHLANLNNKLICVIDYYISNSFSLQESKLIIKQVSGEFATNINEIIADRLTSANSISNLTSLVDNNKLYFVASARLNGDTRFGIWCVDDNGKISLDYIEEEATSIQGIIKLANTWILGHSADGSVNRSLQNSASPAQFTYTSIYESLIFNHRDAGITKKLLGVSVMTEPLSSTAQIVLKYRKDEDLDGSWTTIFTNTTDDSVSYDVINISGATLPQFKEIQFRIESTGGAVITGLKFKYEIIDKQLY